MPVADLPDDCLVYLMGSRYCETDRLSQIALGHVRHTSRPAGARVQAICDFVNGHIRFDYLQARVRRAPRSRPSTSASACAATSRIWRSRFCRCLNIPARYVNGHLGDIGVPVVDPMDFSAWIEVFLDGAWRTFDPAQQRAAHRPHRGRARPRRRRHPTDQLIRAACAEIVPRLDLRGHGYSATNGLTPIVRHLKQLRRP